MKKYKKYRLIDFLEDEKFRHWVLSGDSASGKEEWDQVLETYEAAEEAKLILESLDRHYNQYAMTPEEINEKLQLDSIHPSNYIFGISSALVNFLGKSSSNLLTG